VFLYHDAFNPNREEVTGLKERCRWGPVGDVEVKRKLATALNAFLDPIHEQWARYEAHMGLVRDALADAADRTRRAAQAAMALVRKALDLGSLEKFRGP
jgi:tryptophanyl-tRNA synthetase